MNRPVVILAAVAVFLAACSADPKAPEAASSPDVASACTPQLDEAFRSWADAGFSGSIALSTGGELGCLAAYGLANEATHTPNTVDTVFSIGSVTKAFTAAAVFALVDDGKLALDDRVGDLVPALDGRVAGATVEQLLVHAGGLTGSHARDDEPLDQDAAVAAIGRLEQAFVPGSGYQYSNAGYTLLALIVEEVSGTTYRDYVASRILRLPGGDIAGGFWSGEPTAPGPRALGYFDDGSTGESGDFAGPHWALDGNGGLAMTTEDLVAWTNALFTGELVSPQAAEAISTPGVDLGDGASETPGWVAIASSVYGEPVFTTAGGGGEVGHNVVVAWLPESERVVAIASNTPGVSAEELLQAVGPALIAGDPLPTPDTGSGSEAAADDVEADLGALAGTYDLATGGALDVTADDGRLAVAARGADALAALFPLPPAGGFIAEDVTAHEAGVVALLAGETQEGREERAAFEGSFGPIEEVELVGTIVDDGELRTYVTVTSGATPTVLWYALDEGGAIAAAEVQADPPTLRLVPTDGGRYRPDDPTGTGPEVTVAFDNGRMNVTGPTGSTSAQLAA